ncbi:MAG: hypothetical protein JST16_17965 [Bdellovibrionales bacterium]|nr:hypothetical protein [Bdellovibrionales bacterium]
MTAIFLSETEIAATAQQIESTVPAILGDFPRFHPEMIILAIAATRQRDVVKAAIREVSGFVPGIDDSHLGSFYACGEAAIDKEITDAGRNTIRLSQAQKILAAALPEPAEGRTITIQTESGALHIDRTLYAESVGRSRDGTPNTEYRAGISIAMDKLQGAGERVFLIVVKGSGAPRDDSPVTESGLPPLTGIFTAMTEGQASRYDVVGRHKVPGLTSGWQLLNHPQFKDLLGHIQAGKQAKVFAMPDGLQINI